MTLNLSREQFGTKVICDKLARDECPVENLLSNNPTVSRKGYVAERFISPPVTITFTFQWPILIHSIIAKCSVDSLQTKIIQVSSSSADDHFIFGGSGKVEIDCDILEFVNNHYVGDEPERNNVYRTVMSKLTNRHFFGNHGIKSLRLKLIGGHSVLGFIEIWGRPSSRKDVETALSIANSYINEIKDIPVRHFNSESPKKSNKSDKNNICDIKDTRDRRRLKRKLNELSNDIIPQEFIDDLTNEIMILPYILPSGKIVDKSTIEKHNEQEMKWNRQPNDPFTSIPYNDKSKPVYHTSLKARIDEFLIQNENFGSKRTVGGKEQSCSKLVKTEIHGKEESIEKAVVNTSATLVQSSSNSLNDVLADVLSQIPDRTTIRQKEHKECGKCNSKTGLYKIVSCSHLICRNCITNEKKLCPSCKIEYDSAKIVKVHCI